MLSSRSARALAVALLAVLLGAMLPAATAQAASRTVQGGRLDWGIKSSFQSYVTGPIAQGSWSLTGGAATVGGSQFRFHSANGSYDPATGAFSSGFSGGVHFTGHKKADGTNELDLVISRPTVRINGGSGTLFADMVSKERGTGKVTNRSQVPLATLGLGGINMKGGSTPIALTNVPTTLTAQGASAFAGYYTAGTPLDPISLSVDTKGAPAEPKPSPSEKKDEDAEKDKAKKKAEQEKAGRFEDAAVDWGVRRTFREYVTGSIGQGKWTLADGAQDGGALFRFPQGKGTYDAKKQTLDADFGGSIHFTGAHDLDLKFSGVTVAVAKGEGTLSADVTSAGTTRKDVPLITFAAKDFAPEGGLAVLTEVPATLTEDGAKAFGSMYKAGTEMDPVSLAVTVDAKAQLPALPDLGSEPTAAAEPTAKPSAEPSAEPVAAASDSGPGAGTYAAIGGGVLLLAAAGAFFALRRRKASGIDAASTGSDAPQTS
ncbi:MULTISPECIES: HtaA domain-containing protein [unclassified Streptomyces]|uniref:HtaA domain-containing protein n=1 Tax=unclassified Streptomyces TaxID=2593676 RepID=UPI00081F5450|nr:MULTISPECIES: HtaA domain-containing protein [unclassified Streptomyces]MYR94328.1 Htaa domain protein [Streptomyces sp. SID4937]SCD69491.1 Htaa protein [Streptomyces sp. ScaeMP-e83]